ncbi:hypothetical protein [Methanosarcina horonobensis]|uniref:hypothetical protein n=1 Tax=Methanosarcina horonobensis TaxID=418008 RepID=UPI0022B87FE9|nr:hypothetical protein [Methanosarcina horonobensis]
MQSSCEQTYRSCAKNCYRQPRLYHGKLCSEKACGKDISQHNKIVFPFIYGDPGSFVQLRSANGTLRNSACAPLYGPF